MSNDPTRPVPVPVPTPEPDSTTATRWLEEHLTSDTEGQQDRQGQQDQQSQQSQTAPENDRAESPGEPVVQEPTYLTGPAPTAIIIGLIGLLTLVSTAVWALTDWAVNWAVAAPVGIVALGVVIVLLGVSGLRRPRPRS